MRLSVSRRHPGLRKLRFACAYSYITISAAACPWILLRGQTRLEVKEQAGRFGLRGGDYSDLVHCTSTVRRKVCF